jgi:hypothetical protein
LEEDYNGKDEPSMELIRQPMTQESMPCGGEIILESDKTGKGYVLIGSWLGIALFKRHH